MNPSVLIMLLVMLFLSWLGTNALDKRGRKRQRAVQGSYEPPQHNLPVIQAQRGGDQGRFKRSMLSVGRETNISEREVVCRVCSWEGIGQNLSTGLARIDGSEMFLYAYRCPVCSGFELSRKGKLLEFSSQHPANQQQTATAGNRHTGAGGGPSQWK